MQKSNEKSNGKTWTIVGILLASSLGFLGWAGRTLYSGIDNRVGIIERDTKYHVTKSEMEDLIKRLDRIESKVDALLLERRTK